MLIEFNTRTGVLDGADFCLKCGHLYADCCLINKVCKECGWPWSVKIYNKLKYWNLEIKRAFADAGK